MFKFRKRQLQEHEITTTKDVNSLRADINKDGIPDFLERKDIPSIISTNKDLNQWEADTEKEIEEWIMGLRGYEFNPDKNMYVPTSPPRMNEIGIAGVKTHLKAVVNKHSINTGLSSDGVHDIVKTQSKSFVSWLRDNAKKIDISYSDLTPIADEFDNFSYLVLSRSINDGQRSHVTKRTSLHGQVGTNPAI